MDLKFKIESLLFISGQPFGAEKIAAILKIKKAEAEEGARQLKEEYEKNERGMRIAAVENKYQMVTAPEAAALVGDFLKEEILGELTRPQLEALTVIAYRGPISKFELEQIRGVNCSIILRNLLIRGLVEQKAGDGGLDKYIVTHDFMKYLGLTDLKDLPDYGTLNADKNLQDLLQRTKDKSQISN